MRHFASLAERGREAIRSRDAATLGALIDENFDTRRGIYALPAWQVDMVETARRVGATAKFAGSGGATVGTYRGRGDVRQAPGGDGGDRITRGQTTNRRSPPVSGLSTSPSVPSAVTRNLAELLGQFTVQS